NYDCYDDGPKNELRADEISVPLIRELATGKLGELHAKMRAVADAMIAAVPESVRVVVPLDVRGWVATQDSLPAGKRACAALHPTRQRVLLAEAKSFAASTAACRDPFSAMLASRHLLPGTVRTEHTVAGGFSVPALDSTGRLWSVPVIGEDGKLVIT